MILYYFPIAQNTVNKTVSDCFQIGKCLFMNVHIFCYFSFYWSDTSLKQKGNLYSGKLILFTCETMNKIRSRSPKLNLVNSNKSGRNWIIL